MDEESRYQGILTQEQQRMSRTADITKLEAMV